MGDPRRPRKQYSGPNHPWQKARLDDEREFVKEFGLRNKKEVWRHGSMLKKLKDRVKKSIIETGEQAEIERKQLLEKAMKIGLIKADQGIDDILNLTVKDVLARRIQTILFKKDLARSMKQARQFITHGHVTIGDKKITVPTYIVSVDEEAKVGFDGRSTLDNTEHPERQREEKPEEVAEKAKAKDKEKPKASEKKEEVKEAPKKKEKKEEPKEEKTEELKEEKKDEKSETPAEKKATKEVKEEKKEDKAPSDEPNEEAK